MTRLGEQLKEEAQVTFQVVEGVNENILSVNRALDVGASVLFETDNCSIQWADGSVATFRREGRQFLLPFEELEVSKGHVKVAAINPQDEEGMAVVLVGWIGGLITCDFLAWWTLGLSVWSVPTLVSAPSAGLSSRSQVLSAYLHASAALRTRRRFPCQEECVCPFVLLRRLLVTQDSILQTFENCPLRLLAHASRLSGSSLSRKDRVLRAWLAGQWAAAVQTQRIGSPNRSCVLDSTLSCMPLDLTGRPIGGASVPLGSSSSMSQAFLSEIEAKIYLEPAGEPDPVIAP
eukprot:s3763_g1.t1